MPGATATTVIFPAAIIAPASGDVLYAQNALNVQTIDAEGTIGTSIHSTELALNGGLRFATTHQQMSAVASRLGFPIGELDWTRDFEGFGPTLSATATDPIFGGLSAVGKVRESLVTGDKNLNRTVIGDVTPAAVAGSRVVGFNNADKVVASGDPGIGLRYTTQINQQADIFLQATFESQLWTETGPPTLTFLGFQGIGLALGMSY